MYKKNLTAICLLASGLAYADGPTYEVFPQLKSLKVSYHVGTTKKQTIIYATNHEKIAVICDAAMTTNKQEKSKKREILIGPGKTIEFPFQHGSAITSVRLYLMCEEKNDAVLSGSVEPEETKNNDAQPEKLPPVIIEEDLDKI